MNEILIISDHQLISDLYRLNLSVYLGVDVTVARTIEKALACIELKPDFKVILTLSLMNNIDAGEQIVEICKDLESKIIVIGEKSSVSNTSQVITVPANLNIPNIVKTVASILGVTAREMAEKEVPDYYSLPIKMLRHFDVAPCSIYYNISKSNVQKEFVKIIALGDEIKDKIEGHLDNNIHSLFIPSSMRLEIVNKVSEIISDKMDEINLPVNQNLDIAEEGFELVANSFTNVSKVSEEIATISKKCIEKVGEAVKSVPKLKGLMSLILENKSGFLYTHSVLATYVATHIIRNISWGSEEHIEKVSFVLFFHDIFLGPLYNKYPHFQMEEDLIFNDELDEKDKEILLNHAVMASEMVKNFPRCPMGADTIILQHHGTTNGLGFTLDYKDDISPLAKVIIVAEEFVCQLLKQKEKGIRPFRPQEIVGHLREKFTRHTYKKIINPLETIDF